MQIPFCLFAILIGILVPLLILTYVPLVLIIWQEVLAVSVFLRLFPVTHGLLACRFWCVSAEGFGVQGFRISGLTLEALRVKGCELELRFLGFGLRVPV